MSLLSYINELFTSSVWKSTCVSSVVVIHLSTFLYNMYKVLQQGFLKFSGVWLLWNIINEMSNDGFDWIAINIIFCSFCTQSRYSFSAFIGFVLRGSLGDFCDMSSMLRDGYPCIAVKVTFAKLERSTTVT
jgi:hypothetical protein